MTLALSRHAVIVSAAILCGTVIQAVAGIGADQPFTAVDLQSADAPPTASRVDLVLADDWGTVSIDPNYVISVEPVVGGSDEVCRVAWRDGEAVVRGSVRQTRKLLGLEPVR